MAPNPYETTQNNFSGTSTNPGGQNIYESTQGNFSGTGGGYTGPSMADIQDMMNTTLGNYQPPVYSGPSLEDFGSMMDNKLGGYMTPDQAQAMMESTMANYQPPVYSGPSLEDFGSMMDNKLGGYMTPEQVQAMMSGTMGGGGGYQGPSAEDWMAKMRDLGYVTNADVENMMSGTMGNFSAGPSMADIESLMESTMGNYMTPEQVQAMMESTMGASEPGSVSSTVNVDLGGDTPGLSPTELENLMQSTMGISMADFVSGGNDPADMDADGDGKVTQAELDAYAGNVYSYDAPDNQFGDSVTNLNQSVIDMLNDPFGENGIPAIANFMDDLSIRQDQADADFEQNLVNRGITDSSIADNMRMQHERNQNNERAMLQTNLMQNVVPLYSQTGMGYEAVTDADRQQSLGDFFSFLDRQVAENRWTDQQAAQGLSLMLNALGMGTINPSMPAFNIPAGQPGAGQSIGNLIGNLGTAYLGSGADLSWLGG
jgi:hypothetical protein